MLSSADAALLFKALSDETRLRIVGLVAGGEKCACDLLEAFALTQPTISYHMKILTECGLVRARREGAWMRYTLDPAVADALRVYLEDATREGAEAQDAGTGCDRCGGTAAGEDA
ncbi:MAG: winged helix-turn-helix transcriptional regulator [Clostridia bacterium]|nr:winged helix-turn-helix transcriptional regulator [Clostridia bacterium]